jgi:hypothetical protein
LEKKISKALLKHFNFHARQVVELYAATSGQFFFRLRNPVSGLFLSQNSAGESRSANIFELCKKLVCATLLKNIS